jgi:acyl dehydratase
MRLAIHPRRYAPGDHIPMLQIAPVTRATVALFAGASNDYNPMHIDLDAARAAGMDDVFVQGMLSMAYLGRALTNSFGPRALREFGVRFTAITHVRDRLECFGEVMTAVDSALGQRLSLRLTVINSRGEPTLSGDAIVEIDLEDQNT